MSYDILETMKSVFQTWRESVSMQLVTLPLVLARVGSGLDLDLGREQSRRRAKDCDKVRLLNNPLQRKGHEKCVTVQAFE